MLTFFETKKTKHQKSHLRNLIALAKTDGFMSDSEIEYIFRVGDKMGLKYEDTQAVLEDVSVYDFVKPSNDDERFNEIFNLVQLMLVEGKIEDAEMDFCIEIARKSGVRPAIAGVLVRKITMDLMKGLNKETIKAQVKSFLLM
ncbi:TerB family tellurite resistance protein [Cytophagaceae bacterium ABcell3]|nr:TerB family tellurite resistance protein [Cytophagaceae bacterium ABcell3]